MNPIWLELVSPLCMMVAGVVFGFYLGRARWVSEPPGTTGAYGLPLCECETPKDVVPMGCARWMGWCGHCGKDLESKP